MTADPSPPTFAATDLACLRGGRMVFDGLGFAIEAGDALALTGANGSGKSSLLRLLAGLSRPFAGTLSWRGRPISEDSDAHRARIAYVGHADGVKAGLTAFETLSFWAALHEPREAAARAERALEDFDLSPLRDVLGRYLSSGQKRRLGLARLLASPGALWLLDEPTVGLDAASVSRLEVMVARHRDRGGIVVLATHMPVALPGALNIDLDAFSVDPASSWGTE
ncbi:heme ABC exporter ATP-binding protein CcmA [Inquilinus sp. CAU 1745]|uniref:heme ABC exporter ATP-binding protein CcmA n=1 Tax=Inquilinus sp. CAU 1745 TaxID=3140369 RepID=UPI00325C2E7C